MSIRKSIFATALVLISVFAGAADCKGLKKASCDPAHKAAAAAQAPSPECTLPPFVPAPSFTPITNTIGDGLYEAGKDMAPGRWQSVGTPMMNPKCVWFVTPNPSKDPNSQTLPSYTDFKHGYKYTVTFTILMGQGFITKDCGEWKLIDPTDIR